MDDWDFNEEFDDDEGNEIQQDIDEVKEARQTLDEDEDPEVEGEDDAEARAKKKELVWCIPKQFLCKQVLQLPKSSITLLWCFL